MTEIEDAINNTAFKEKRNLSDSKLKTLANQFGFSMSEINYLKEK